MAKKASQTQASAAEPAPFQKPFTVATLSRARPHGFDLRPDGDECAKIASFLKIRGVEDLRFKGDLIAEADDDWRIDARLTAEVTQDCVITLSPVAERIDERVTRQYIPEDDMAEMSEVDLDPDSDDEPEPYRDVIDPGQLAIEALALALDPYPRATDAKLDETRFAPPGTTPLSDDDLKPFAGLAALKDKLNPKDG